MRLHSNWQKGVFWVWAFSLLIVSCTSQSEESKTEEKEPVTNEGLVVAEKDEIFTALSKVMPFHFTNSPDGKKYGDLIEGAYFDIVKDGEKYFAQWKTTSDIKKVPVSSIEEVEKDQHYEFKTTGQDGKIVSYAIRKIDGLGVWTMTNSENNKKRIMCDYGAAIVFERNAEEKPTEKPQDLISFLGGTSWIQLTEREGDYVIYNECMYGSGGLAFDENGKWMEFSGGGDAFSSEIKSVKQINSDAISIFATGDGSDTETEYNVVKTEDGTIIFDPGSDYERRFILEEASGEVLTVNEECDDEGM